jgi:Carboxypeptidase regulatory-like domain/TonB dependent receptor
MTENSATVRWLQRGSLLLFLVLFAVLFTASPLFASGPTGTITGTITDPSGAVVPKARVIVRNEGTNATRDAETNEDGDYTVALLPPGHYFVAVESKGFRRSVIHEVGLNVDQTVRLDFALQVGATAEEVSVTETPPIVQTDTSTLGQVVNNRLVQDLPLNERNFLNFALLVPGSHLPAEGSENSTQGGAISVNGAREQSNNFLLDGVDNNDPYINQYVALPSIDAIQEFKVQSSNYSAEFGHGAGAQVNVILKSGANQFHGSLFEFFRNRHMDAKNFFDLPSCTASSPAGTCGDIPRFDRNQFGGTLGGPLRKDKTFFFLAYEGLRLRQATAEQATIPTPEQWAAAQGLADSIPFFGCPSSPSCKIGLKVQKLYPAQGNVATNPNIFQSSPIIHNTENLVSAKVDEHASPADTISLHYSLFDGNRFSPFDPVNAFTSLPGYGSFTSVHGQNAGIEWTRVFRSSVVNEFRLGFIRMRATVLQQDHGTDIAAQLGFPDILTNPVDLGPPNINLIGFDGIGAPVNYPQDRHDTTLQLSDNVAWTVGRNQFKIGADVRRVRIENYLDFIARGDWLFLGNTAAAFQGYPNNLCIGPPPGSPPGTPSEDPSECSLAQLLGGVPDAAIAVSGNTFNTLNSHGVSAYVQDDIHVIPRFLLNVGLRYEFNTPPVEAKNRFSVPELIPCPMPCLLTPQFNVAGTNGIPRATYNSTYRDIAPRIGIAWRPLKSERWVVRSAYGIFYDVPISQINILPRINPPFYNLGLFQQSFNCPEGGGVFGLCTVPNILSQASGLVQSNMISPRFRDGYTQQWNADLQYEVGPNWMIDLAYVASKGTHLPNVIDRNQFDPVTGPPYGQFSSVLFIESNATSSYQSLQFRSEKRVSHGLAFLAAYTFSKSTDDISSIFGGNAGSGLPQDSQNLAGDRGLSDFNAKHRVSLSFLYDLPFRRMWAQGPNWSRKLLDNWQTGGIFAAQSGAPFTVVLAGSPAASAAAFGNPERPDLVGDPFKGGPVAANPNCQAPAQVNTIQSWYNQCAFAAPVQENFGPAFGTEGRNILTAPGYTNLDFSLAKSIPFRAESHRLQLRGEFFNLLNHPNLDIPNHVFDMPPCPANPNLICPAGNYGSVLAANAYGNRPPRQIQLSVKYIF